MYTDLSTGKLTACAALIASPADFLCQTELFCRRVIREKSVLSDPVISLEAAAEIKRKQKKCYDFYN